MVRVTSRDGRSAVPARAPRTVRDKDLSLIAKVYGVRHHGPGSARSLREALAEQEVDIVTRRVAQLGRSIGLPETPHGADEIRRVVTVFRELRQGVTEDGRAKVKSPSGTLSTAEAISVVTSGLALAAHFGDGVLRPADVAGGITGAVVQDPVADRVVWQEYLETVIRDRDEWSDFYRACRDVAAPNG